MKNVDEEQAWREVATRVAEARLRRVPQMSKRAVARAAGISDVHYRNIEAGTRQVARDTFVPPSVSDQILAKVAKVLELDPAELLAPLGRPVPPPEPPDDRAAPSLEDRVTALEEALAEIRQIVRGGTPDSAPGHPEAAR